LEKAGDVPSDGEVIVSNAIVLTEFGDPSVLQWATVPDPVAEPGEILIRVRAAGVGPTDLNIRAGRLARVFPQKAGSVLGFEAAGTVEAVGEGVAGVAIGDEVAALLTPKQGGYAELVTSSVWHRKPAEVSWEDAAALPASVEAAIGTLNEIHAVSGETLVVLGGAGSVGQLVVQVAREWGLRVIATASERDAQLIRDLGGEPVTYGDGAFDRIRELSATVDAVVDAAGKGGLVEAVTATGDANRVVTLADPAGAGAAGARMSEPGPGRAPGALGIALPLLAEGTLVLKKQRTLPLGDAAEAHRLLESGETNDKIVLVVS